MNHVKKTAKISRCGRYRYNLVREWDDRPMLVVCMFNPSTADHETDDPTISLLSNIASFNGYGGIIVVNGIPLRSSTPEPALKMLEWDKSQDWYDRDRLQENLSIVIDQIQRAGAVLLAWGALAWKTQSSADWFDHIRGEIECALPEGCQIYCLGKTRAGLPLHPLARGKLKVPKTARLISWDGVA